MVYMALTVLAVFVLLVVSEYGWRRRWLANEVGRKFVHVTVGSFVAFWPFFLTWNQIRVLSVAFLLGAAVSLRLKLFKVIHGVQRPTFGELCFAVTVGVMTYVTYNKGIYAAALLQMSLADGFAAVFGSRYGGNGTYKLFGHTKSVVGTTVFLIVSAAILLGYAHWTGHDLSAVDVATGATVAAFLENVMVLGFDNLLVPLFVGWLLTSLI